MVQYLVMLFLGYSDGNSTTYVGLHPDRDKENEALLADVVNGELRFDDHMVNDKLRESAFEETNMFTYELTQEQYNDLKSSIDSYDAEDVPYDLNDFNCVDFTLLELSKIGIDVYDNPLDGFLPDLLRSKLQLIDDMQKLDPTNPEHQAYLDSLNYYDDHDLTRPFNDNLDFDNDGIPDYLDPDNYNPNDGYPLNPPSDDDNTNAPDSGNNNDEDNEDNEEDNEDITQVNLSVSSASASESAGYMNFFVTLSQALEADLSFNFSTPNGSATTGSDFYGSGGTGVISAGSTQLTISVFLLDDDEHEDTEYFSLTLSNIQTTAQNVSVVYAGDVTGTITDDDPDEDDRDDDDAKDDKEYDEDGCIKPEAVPCIDCGSSGSSGGSGSSSSGSSSVVYYAEPSKYKCEQTKESTALPTGQGKGSAPIVLDLNHDSITSIALADSQALFDYQGDTLLEHTAWIQSGDALLAIDLNNDGVINNGGELFGEFSILKDGSYAKNGYEALAEYDSNQDGVIDSQDTEFYKLLLFKDSNQNAQTEAGELLSLESQDITQITLPTATTPTSYTPENTNLISEQTSFTQAGMQGVVRDLWFKYENLQEDLKDVYFDMDGNGFAERMKSWADTTEWILVKDINGDGLISDGSELVSKYMLLENAETPTDSYHALRTLDTNKDVKPLMDKKYTTIKINIKYYKFSYTSQEYFASIKKHFPISKDNLWHVEMNNSDYYIEREVA